MRKSMVLVLVLVLAFSFTAAGQQTPVQGGTFRYGITVNPRGMFNPILNTEVYDGYIIDQVFDGLIYIDSHLEPQPKLAESWEISDDGLSITFHFIKA